MDKINTIVDIFGQPYQISMGGLAEPHSLAKEVIVWFQDDAKFILRKFDLTKPLWKELLFSLEFGMLPFHAREGDNVRNVLAKHLCRSKFRIYELKEIERITIKNSRGKLYSFMRGPALKYDGQESIIYDIKSEQQAQNLVHELDKSNDFWIDVLVRNKLVKPNNSHHSAYSVKGAVHSALLSGDLVVYEKQYSQKPPDPEKIQEAAHLAPLSLGPHEGKKSSITKKFMFLLSS